MKFRYSLPRRIVGTLVLAVMVVLGGCGGRQAAPQAQAPAQPAPAQPAPAQPAKMVEIEFWHGLGGKLGESMQAMIDDFNKANPTIKVKGVFLSDYSAVAQKLQAAMAAGNAPAMAQLRDGDVQRFAAAGKLAALNDFIDKEPGFDIKDVVPGFLEATSYQGKIYGLPLNRSTPLLFYRKDILQANGIDPKELETWEGVRKVSQELVKKGAVKYGVVPIKDAWFFYSLIRSAGAPEMVDGKINLDAPQAAKALQLWADLIHKDKVATVHYGGQGWAYWYDSINDVMQGRAAMYTGSTGDQSDLDQKIIGATFMPKFAGQEHSVPFGGGNGGILADAKPEQKEAAWKFIKWFSDKEQTARWATRTGYMPVRFSAAAAMADFFKENPNFKVAVDQLKYAKSTPVIPEWSKVEAEAITPALEQVHVNNKPSAEALQEAARKAREILGQK